LNKEIGLLQMDKVITTLKQIVRDWSIDGEQERNVCYRPIINDLNKLYDTISVDNKKEISVLVPGCGLGRLAYEIAKLGFKCEGNEFSLFMLITSNFILNK
jgi:carnosine N-methyltransferase